MTACTSTLPRYATCRAPARTACTSFAPSRLPSAATQLPEMFDRTVTLSSAGKTFSVTGWQAGWCVGPSRLVRHIQLLLPFVQFCVATPVQQACFACPTARGPWITPRLCRLSRVLAAADEPYGAVRATTTTCASHRHKREILATGLRRCGMQPLRGNGGFFLMAETSRLTVPEEYLRQTTAAAPEMTRDWCALPRHRPARFGPFRRRRRHPSPSPRQGVVPMARVRGGRDRDSMRTVLLVCAQASCREPRALRLLQERRNAH